MITLLNTQEPTLKHPIYLNAECLEIGEHSAILTIVYDGDLTLHVSHEIDISREGVYDWCYYNGDDHEVLVGVNYDAVVNITNIDITDENRQLIEVNAAVTPEQLLRLQVMIATAAEQQAEEDDNEARENEEDEGDYAEDWEDEWEDDCYE